MVLAGRGADPDPAPERVPDEAISFHPVGSGMPYPVQHSPMLATILGALDESGQGNR
jgi:hypothetical protein